MSRHPRFRANTSCKGVSLVFSFPFRKKARQKPSKEGVNLLASILVCYEEITKVGYEPKDDTIRLTFSIEEAVTKPHFDQVGRLLAESVAAFLDLSGIRPRVMSIEMETAAGVSFLHLIRDVESLTRDELSLIADVLYDAFPETLLLDDRDPLDPNFEVEQENLLDHMLGAVRQHRLKEKLLGIREGDRVVVYNQ